VTRAGKTWVFKERYLDFKVFLNFMFIKRFYVQVQPTCGADSTCRPTVRQKSTAALTTGTLIKLLI